MPQPTLRARVTFTPLSADRAKREWWLGIVREQQAADGVILMLAAVEGERLVGWLLSFGRTAIVLAPAHLRTLLVKAGRERVSPGFW